MLADIIYFLIQFFVLNILLLITTIELFITKIKKINSKAFAKFNNLYIFEKNLKFTLKTKQL